MRTNLFRSLVRTVGACACLAWATFAKADAAQAATMPTIDNRAKVNLEYAGDIIVAGKIDGQSNVRLVSTKGSIIITDKIDGSSVVVLKAPNGSITIGTNIDGASNVSLEAGGTIDIRGKIDNGSSRVKASAGTTVTVSGEINGGLEAWFRGTTVAPGSFIDNAKTMVRVCGKVIPPPGGIRGGAQLTRDCDWQL